MSDVRSYAEAVLANNPHADARDHARAVLALVDAQDAMALAVQRWQQVVDRCGANGYPCSSCVARAQLLDEFRQITGQRPVHEGRKAEED